MTDDSKMQVRFWGVRGSTPTPQLNNLGYGGNTPCVEILCPGHDTVIFDGGTGIRDLGQSLDNQGPVSVKLFLTHFHWDHIQGIPFFSPLYHPESEVTFCAFGRSGGPEGMLVNQMQAPYFPVDVNLAAARKKFVEIQQQPVKIGDLRIHPFPLNHPQGAMGYRIEFNSQVVVYATDLEHGEKEYDKILREYSQNADLLIYDAQYTPDEYENQKGWGHSTWLEATLVANDCQVEQLLLFHHDPGHDDETLEQIVLSAREHFERTDAAREDLNGASFIRSTASSTSSELRSLLRIPSSSASNSRVRWRSRSNRPQVVKPLPLTVGYPTGLPVLAVQTK